ncbi:MULTISPECIES: 16S rRNA (guanine(527)-N(7))-methyltransferase RsmG [Subtercola]|uniref:Ribosomal RNA small subunit methyltransferase G n=1 Tax=Subtercola vilae TaxID=2056433 RepID=A0A4T2CAY7_9MICO|nr:MULTISPECIES: 16S rRNA (guanine(527)-N(7))-methyltransferase RsmG [Subtercola]MEA9985383.1 16S rRNA (guanine(527)-N(7))-methyltransferase RsmG [Subtercola sp. RTI3]TIH40999.1 16S rRNA (guanine(527)-N(7))-methyltransferase RsmG [Subtercola vilae]
MDTVESEPAAAATIFGPHIAKARAFTTNLVRFGDEYGLIGPMELPRLWTRHVLNCAVVAPLLKHGRVGDIGSGAGLPGLVLAIARPDVEFVLIEPMERRVKWLNEQTSELELANVTVIRGRAQDVGFTGGLDQITARAVSAFGKLIPMCAPLVKHGGELVLMKGSGAEAEIEAAAKPIRKFRLTNVEVLDLGVGVLAESTRVIRATVG